MYMLLLQQTWLLWLTVSAIYALLTIPPVLLSLIILLLPLKETNISALRHASTTAADDF